MSGVVRSFLRIWSERAICLVVASCFIVVGCGKKEEVAPTQESDASKVTEDSCRSRLEGALRRLPPDSLSALTRLDTSVGALNAWLVDCAADDLTKLKASEANLAFLDTTAQRVVSAPRFTARDATYVRDSLITARLAQSIIARADAAGADSEAERLGHVFRWVGQNISVETSEEAGTSKGYLETLLTGRGSMRSRVWILAVLLRQLQRDAVLLSPAAAEDGDDPDEYLVAVCLDQRILLFDPQTWLPISARGDDSVLVVEPAGVEYLEAHEAWKQPRIQVIAETSAVGPRLLVLQQQLPAEASAVLYEELAGGTSEILPLVDRVVAAAPGAFDASRVSWWTWPDEQVTAAAASDEQQKRRNDAMMKPFEAPFERKPVQLDTDFKELLSQPGLTQDMRDSLWAQRWEMEYQRMAELEKSGDSEKLFGRPSSRLLKTRLAQVEGSHDRSIIQQLQRIRNACIDDAISFSVPVQIEPSGIKSIPIPEAIQSVNRRATGSALYWIAICQMDRSQPGIAITSFANYRRQYPDGPWYYPSLVNQAIAELAQGRLDAAAKSLAAADHPENPEQAHAAGLLKRVQAVITSETDSADADPDQTSSETPAGAADESEVPDGTDEAAESDAPAE